MSASDEDHLLEQPEPERAPWARLALPSLGLGLMAIAACALVVTKAGSTRIVTKEARFEDKFLDNIGGDNVNSGVQTQGTVNMGDFNNNVNMQGSNFGSMKGSSMSGNVVGTQVGSVSGDAHFGDESNVRNDGGQVAIGDKAQAKPCEGSGNGVDGLGAAQVVCCIDKNGKHQNCDHASVGGSAGSSGSASQTSLGGLLQSKGLESFKNALSDFGVEKPSDMEYVGEKDLKKMGMNPIQVRKFMALAKA